MRRALIYIAGRWYEARSNRAFTRARKLKKRAEKFFHALSGRAG